ncbi:MAG: hypothetical protein RL660_3159 [Bacteroidota bacterium]|jgi:ketosteroid isomerase-like protein
MPLRHICIVKIRILFLFIVLTLTSTIANAQKKILKAEADRYAAMIAQDTATLSAMLSSDLVYIHSNGMTDTKQSFLNSVATKTLVHKKITTSNVVVRKYKDVAIVTGNATYDINYKNADMVLEFVFTNVYKKKKDKWILISRHTCRVIKE